MSQTPTPNFAQEYLLDAWQEWIFTLDTLRERGNFAVKRSAQTAPNDLAFMLEPVCDGWTLPKSVNYVLLRIVRPAVQKVANA